MELRPYPDPATWEERDEIDPRAWPRETKKPYTVVPTICFNCEAACGLLAYVDKQTLQIRKLEGNPFHPASRGRNCAKGPATLNQVNNPDRILHPLRRKGPRGGGEWERVSWNDALDDIAARIRAAIAEGRRNEIMYHVGRPGEDGFVERTLQAWGLDAHNSHTNVCSSGARLGYAAWMGFDRPSPDHAGADYILLLSAHLETGHYFNPHAQRISEAKQRGARLVAIDTRLSNTASMADAWLPTRPGSEAAVLLAMANLMIRERLFDREFVRRWVNWEEYLRYEHPDAERAFDLFVAKLEELYAPYTPEFAAAESGVPAETIVREARLIARAGPRFATHVWRNAASGNLHGWLVARALFFLNVLTGSVGARGGVLPNGWNKFVPVPWKRPPGQKVWNELLWPREYPFAHHEMSFLLPYFLKEGRGRLAVYFTRVYNPVWTNPDGFSWIEVLTDESKVGLHVALTPEWSETAHFADYVLPMGHAPERHDTMSFETHDAQWIGFRMPVRRVAIERRGGERPESTLGTNPGEVWEEAEFWLEVSWRIDPDGSLGIRPYFESPYRPGEKMTAEEHYRWIFENSVPGLPDAAMDEGLSPLDYMKKYGAFEIAKNRFGMHEREVERRGGEEEGEVIVRDGQAAGVVIDGAGRAGFPTPSRKLEFYSTTLAAWGWRELAVPTHRPSHVHPSKIDAAKGEFTLLPTFRLPTQIHTRSGNSKWLWELSNTNPVWMNARDARRLGLRSGELVRVSTDTGWFVNRLWVTEGIAPGVVACSHHFGRWRLFEGMGSRWSSALSALERDGSRWRLRRRGDIGPFESDDPDSARVTWREGGVHQNLAFPSHPDPLSGMHCWHQRVRVERAREGDRYGDVCADTERSMAIYREWLAMTRPGPGPGGLRRPTWLARPFRPDPSAFKVSASSA
jgi:anaerobic selenocysteine-containing dehydrogenase